MGLINCPECNKQISDRAPACIQCGYPLHATSKLNKPEINPQTHSHVPNSQITNRDLALVLATKKSEGLAFILTFLLGPLGLFYADVKKALILIVVGFFAAILALVIDSSYTLYVGLSIALWLISIFIALTSVSEFNSKISSDVLLDASNTSSTPSYNASTDSIQELHRLMQVKSGNLIFSNTLKESIVSILNEICEDNSACYFLIKEYKHRYKSDLVEDLKDLSNSYETIKHYLKPFIDFGLVSKDFPHKPINI